MPLTYPGIAPVCFSKVDFPDEPENCTPVKIQHSLILKVDVFLRCVSWIVQIILPFKHFKLLFQGNKFDLGYCSVDLIKGYARASVIAFVVMVDAEIDLDAEYDKVKPFEAFLDKAFLLPSHVSGHYVECQKI